MELREFISQTLIAITEAVADANKVSKRFRLANNIHADGTSGVTVDFDIQVVVSDSAEKNVKGGLGISVLNLGAEAKSDQTNKNSHRLSFKVFISESET